jgi:hypothetical protein
LRGKKEKEKGRRTTGAQARDTVDTIGLGRDLSFRAKALLIDNAHR